MDTSVLPSQLHPGDATQFRQDQALGEEKRSALLQQANREAVKQPPRKTTTI